MKKTALAAFAGFMTMFIVNGLMAAVVIGPLFESRYEAVVADSVNFPLLVLGYTIIAIAMALLYLQLQPNPNWFQRSLSAGLLVGAAIFFGTHTVITGYTTIDVVGFVLSGLFDSVGPALGMVAIGYVYHRFQLQM